jgi:DNA-binding LacI/PurR family transcriptional regulator
MQNTNPTIYDVARTAGVSIATVSRVLNFPSKVNPVTRTTVMNAIDHLGYIPKAESRARALKSTGRIGVLIPFFTEPSFVQRLRGIASVLSQRDFEMVIFPVDFSSRMKSYMEALPLNRNLDGLIIVSQALDLENSRRIRKHNLETVLIEYFDPHFSSLQIDDEYGGGMAARYLLKKDFKRFAFIGGTSQPEFGVDPISIRLKGFQNVIEEAGFSLGDDLIYPFAFHPGEALDEIISKGGRVAIFAATDLQAISLLKEARMRGLRVPQDVAIIGFDDLDMANYVGLTTVHQPLDESGRIAADLLLSRLDDPSRSIQHITLPLKIIERETV